MATTAEANQLAATSRLGGLTSGTATLVERRKVKPVKWFAAVGVLVLLAWVLMGSLWVLSGNFERTHPGSHPMPEWMRWSLIIQQWLAVPEFGAALWFFLIRPWRRAGHITLDGYLTFAVLSLYWQDHMANSLGITWIFNANLVNWGSWANFQPFWIVPNGDRFVEPVLWMSTCWLWGVLTPVVIANWLMRKAQDRWPRMGTIGVVGVAFGVLLFFDLLLELSWIWTGMYTYPSAISWMTIFHGHYFQFPVYEAVLWTGFWVTLACVRYYKNDRGETVAERGIEEVRASTKQKRALRCLAFVGVFNLAFLLTYNIPMSIITVAGNETWPDDIVHRTYFTNGLCGPDTGYACPGQRVPIAHTDSARVGINGELIPDQVR